MYGRHQCLVEYDHLFFQRKMTRFGKRIALVGCLFGMCLPHKAPSHDAGNFFFDENYETDDKGNKVIGVFPGPTTFTTDLCTALKDGLDVFVQAGAMNCNDLPENFPGLFL